MVAQRLLEKIMTIFKSVYLSLPLSVLLLSASLQAQTVLIGDVTFSRGRLTMEHGGASLAAADFNHDDHQDIAVANGENHSVVIFLGDGSGQLRQAGRYPAGRNPASATAADINADGHIDLVIPNHETFNVTLLIGNGEGSFKPADNSPLTVNVQPHPHVAQARDLDNDGRVDLIVDHRVARGLLVLRGLGEGRFETQGTVVDVGGDPYWGFEISDINGDNTLDFITPNDRDIGITLNLGDMQFERAKSVTSPAPMVVTLADINGDNIPDLISASEDNDQVQINMGLVAGTFQTSPIEQYTLGSGGKQAATGDFNGDGIADVLVSCWNSTQVLVLLGSKQHLQPYFVNVADIKNPWGVVTVDLNKDGRDDFLVAEGGGTMVEIYLSNNQ